MVVQPWVVMAHHPLFMDKYVEVCPFPINSVFVMKGLEIQILSIFDIFKQQCCDFLLEKPIVAFTIQ